MGESLTEVIDRAVEGAATYDEAFEAIRGVLLARGRPADECSVGGILLARLGGDLVETDETGLPTHPLRRRFELAERREVRNPPSESPGGGL